MRVILTREWLLDAENQINAYISNLLEDYKMRNITFQLPFNGIEHWTMETAVNLASLDVKAAKRVRSMNNLMDKKHKVSLELRVEAPYYYAPEESMDVDLLLYWRGDKYVTMGIIIPMTQYSKVAKATNYKIEIACSEGLQDFGSMFMVWYYNDYPTRNGKKRESLPLDIGCTDWYKSNCNIGWGSDEKMTLHGTKIQWGTDLEAKAHQAGNQRCVFDFWKGWV